MNTEFASAFAGIISMFSTTKLVQIKITQYMMWHNRWLS